MATDLVYEIQSFDLTSARTNFLIQGLNYSSYIVLSLDGTASLRIDDTTNPAIELTELGQLQTTDTAQFTKLYLTNSAQTGKTLKIMFLSGASGFVTPGGGGGGAQSDVCIESSSGTKLDILTQDAGYGTASTGLAVFGKYMSSPTTFTANDATHLLTDANGRIMVGGINTDVTVIGKGAAGSAVSGNPVLIAGSDGTNARILKTDASGELQIDIGAIAAGTNNIGQIEVLGNSAADGSGTDYHFLTDSSGHQQIDIVGSLPAGTNEIGKLAAGTASIGDIGTVTTVTGVTTVSTVTSLTDIAGNGTADESDGATATSTSSAQIAAANPNRKGFECRNIDATDRINLSLGGTAVDNTGIVLRAGEGWSMPYPCYTGAINAIASANTPTLAWVEW